MSYRHKARHARQTRLQKTTAAAAATATAAGATAAIAVTAAPAATAAHMTPITPPLAVHAAGASGPQHQAQGRLQARHAAPRQALRTYTVRPGDTLWDIARRIWGNPLDWPALWQANRAIISDPHWIFPDQVFAVPGDPRAIQTASAPVAAPAAPAPPAEVSPVKAAPVAAASPASVVQAYFAAINARNFVRAWQLGGRNFGGTFAAFAAGFADTRSVAVSIVAAVGNVVRVRLRARHADGSLHVFTGEYTVAGGVLTSASSVVAPGAAPVKIGSGEGGGHAPAPAGGSFPAGSDSQNLLSIGRFLMAHGYSRAAAAGIASCVAGESGGNPESVGSGGGGLIGWTPLSSMSQYGGTISGNPTQDLNTQMAAILRYNQVNDGGHLATLKAMSSPLSAAYYYSANFERPAVTGSDVVAAVAAAVYAAL
jgi:hypothetical protein